MSHVNKVPHATGAATGATNNNTSSAYSSSNHGMYINDLPYSCRRNLCEHLDELNVWQQLAGIMSLYVVEIQQITQKQQAGKSPTEALLQIWGGRYNHTVKELFSVFYRQKLYQAMRLIKEFVDHKYHSLIIDSKPDLPALLSPSSNKLLNVSNIDLNTCDNNNTSIYDSSSRQNTSRHETDSDDTNPQNLEKSGFEWEIDYAELTMATDNWSKQNILGKGGFGTVYHGNWKYTSVAIKQIHYKGSSDHESAKIQLQQSLNELKFLYSCRHDNIVALYGYSIKGEKPCLVYQLLKGGSLDDRLYRKKLSPLTWQERMNICFYTARGINYMHTVRQKPLIHGDIKPANVLLDECLCPKIGDFGLAREGPNSINASIQVSQAVGTRYYLPPEYINLKKLSTKVDIYSFGLVVLETFTGLRIYDRNRAHVLLATHIRELSKQQPIYTLIDARQPVSNTEEQEMCISCIQVALNCVADYDIQRPEMEQVLNQLSCYVK